MTDLTDDAPDEASEGEYVALAGGAVPRAELRAGKARALADLLDAGYPFAQPVGLWRFPDGPDGRHGRDAVVFDVDVEVSQRPVHPVRRVERIAAAFAEDDGVRPEPLALRADFPRVPHLNMTLTEYPRSLCLSDQPWEDERLSWTPARFVETVRSWLARTAAGALHQGDQALEPLFGGAMAKIVLPYDLFSGKEGGAAPAAEPLLCSATQPGEPAGNPRLVILAERHEERARKGAAGEALPIVAIPLGVGRPMTHGVIRWQPANLRELHTFLLEAGMDLIGDLRTRLSAWAGDPEMLGRKPVFVVMLPKRRTDDGPVESSETWAFFAAKTLDEIRVSIGVHGEAGGYRGLLLQRDDDKQGEDVELDLLLPYYTLSRDEAALFNGLPAADARSVVAVGLGALGSQVFDNAVRCGFGQWTLVDDDHTLPHNLARHELHGDAVGWAKVIPLAAYANNTIAGPPVATPLVADVLSPGKQAEELTAALAGADLVLDMSASVAVARHLARDREDARGRRVSLFLNPSGTDLVLLAEDAGRRHRLDVLEMQYYRALANAPELADHLKSPDGRLRYGRSCRDVSNTLPQDQVALHAAVGSRAVRGASEDPHARIRVWRSRSQGEDLSLSCIPVTVSPTEERRVGDWLLFTDAALLDRVRDLRAAKLPVETGGVLLGSFDTQRRIVYVADLLPSPPDSVERADLYIRGSEGLRDAVGRAGAATGGWLRYVGEWHSHPAGMGPRPSGDDRKLFGWLKDLMAQEGLPPLMLICGEGAEGWFVGEMSGAEGGGAR